MAILPNDTGALRLRLDLVQRERAAGPAPGRVLATVALEYLDRRDGEHWPVVRLPPLWLPGEAAAALVADVERLVRGELPGSIWQSGEDGAVGLQLQRGDGPSAPVLVELGTDLCTFLADVAGTPARRGTELALFRFATTQAGLVSFGAGLRDELGAIP